MTTYGFPDGIGEGRSKQQHVIRDDRVTIKAAASRDCQSSLRGEGNQQSGHTDPRRKTRDFVLGEVTGIARAADSLGQTTGQEQRVIDANGSPATSSLSSREPVIDSRSEHTASS